MGDALSMKILHNQPSFEQSGFGDDRIKRMSVLTSVYTSTNFASWTSTFIKKNVLLDEIDFFQVGQTDELEFDQVSFGIEESSAFNLFPTRENPGIIYRYGSIYLELSQGQTTIERSTYSSLEFLGDVGGLFDGLKILAVIFVGPVSQFTMKATLLQQNFNFVTSGPQQTSTRISAQPFLSNIKCCRKNNRYVMMLNKAESRMTKQLDLEKFMQRQILLVHSVMALLQPAQLCIADRITSMPFYESSTLEESSANDHHTALTHEKCETINMVHLKGNDVTERRLINLIGLRNAKKMMK